MNVCIELWICVVCFNVRNDSGNVCMYVYDAASTYLRQPAIDAELQKKIKLVDTNIIRSKNVSHTKLNCLKYLLVLLTNKNYYVYGTPES